MVTACNAVLASSDPYLCLEMILPADCCKRFTQFVKHRIFVGVDNNIKLNYGGLQNKGTRYDPFLNTDYLACPQRDRKSVV